MKNYFLVALLFFTSALSLSAQQFNVVGNASTLSCACYQLTTTATNQGGAIWNLNPINLAKPFDFKYRVFLGASNPNSPSGVCGIGADGICFVLQNTSTGVSGNGGGLGYGGFPNQSLGIELDTYKNDWDPAYSHIAIEYNGQVNHPTGTLAGPVQMSASETYTMDNSFHSFEVVWDTTTQTISAYFDGVFRVKYAFPGGIISNIFNGNGSNIYWGFTGATGSYCNLQQVCINFSASFTAQTSCNTDTVTFTSTSVSGLNSIQSYAWNFGDGDTSSAQNPLHVYSKPGAYTAQLVITDQSLCTDTFSKAINVGGIQITDSIAGPDCKGDSGLVAITIGGNLSNYTITWSPTLPNLQQNGNTFFETKPAIGNYQVTVVDTTTGCSTTSQFSITGLHDTLAKPTYYKPLCGGGIFDTINANPGGRSGYTYLWSTGDTTSFIVITPPASFSVTVTNSNTACSSVFSDTIVPDRQIYNNVLTALYWCNDSSFGKTEIYGKGGTGVLTYTIAGVGTNTSGIFPSIISGDYPFTITDTLGCVQNDELIIPKDSTPQTFNVTADSVICPGFNNGTIAVTPNNAIDQVFLYSLDGDTATGNGTFTNVPPGTHVISITNTTFTCTYSESVTITQSSLHSVQASPDTINGSPGAMDTITVTTDYPNPVYEWSPVAGLSCDTCGSITIILDSTMNNSYYRIKVYSVGDSTCYSSDSVFIITKLPNLFVMPNAFAPNGQGPQQNETFGPVYSSSFSTPVIKTFRIYNRWGELIHNANTYWDGKFNGKDQPVGTYVYYIEVQYSDFSSANGFDTYKKEGSVTLLR